ncbi:MAG: HD domain-containing protein, partial [Candidatus Gracilibacteria bacterium]|nr:HD domain-containing protein [Candidatus Gracilibacteria bacterium]
ALSFKDFKRYTQDMVVQIFSLTTDRQTLPVETFLENMDHGALHAFSVNKKANEIAEILEKKTDKTIDRSMLYFMSITHDSGRFHISENEKKQIHCEQGHNRCGMAQVRKGIQSLEKQGINITPGQEADLMDYIHNHDFFNTRLDGDRYKEPQSLEGQIVRLADRMSTDISTEVRRYWETGKRLNTPYFKGDISFEDRVNFSFPKIREYIQSGKFDEFTFFLALLSISGDNFSHPIMQEIYNEWAKNKHSAITTILEIAKKEGFSESDVQEMENLIHQYILHFNLTW